MTPLSRSLRRFGVETRGSASVELVIVLPLLLWALAATAVFFDGFKARYKAEMAAQTVADILSRETQLFTPAYVNGLNTVYDFLADSRYPTRLRVSSLIWDSVAGRPRLQWSYGTNGLAALPTNTFELLQGGDVQTLQALFGADSSFSFAGAATQMPVADLLTRVPPILPGESVMLVETFSLWTPFSNVGMGQMRLSPVVAVRPRFAPWVSFEGIAPIFPETDYELAWTGGGADPLPDPVDPDPQPAPNPTRTFSFDDGVTTGWSRTQTTSGGPTGSFLGIFGSETYATPVTLAVDLLTAGTNATIAFDLILADSWDAYSTQYALPRGDNLTLLIDGQPISMDVFAGSVDARPFQNTRSSAVYLGGATYRLTMVQQTTAPAGTNFVGSSWNDHLWRVTLAIENAPRNFSLGFSAGTDSGASDEGFGLDNLTIAASGTGTAAPFAPIAANLQSVDPHTRFPRYSGCPDQRIAAPWLSMRASDLSTGITFTRMAGGATNLNTCGHTGGLGRMNASPHLILNYDAQSGGNTLQFTMNDGNSGYTCDTTLLIRDPNGQWRFNDDLSGYNAGIRIASAISGHYAVFIGTYGNSMCSAALTINRY